MISIILNIFKAIIMKVIEMKVGKVEAIIMVIIWTLPIPFTLETYIVARTIVIKKRRAKALLSLFIFLPRLQRCQRQYRLLLRP